MFHGLHLERVNWVPVPMTVEVFIRMQWRGEKDFFFFFTCLEESVREEMESNSCGGSCLLHNLPV